MNLVTTDNTRLYPNAVPIGVKGVLDVDLINVTRVDGPVTLPLVSVPLFASSQFAGGYQRVMNRLANKTNTNLSAFISQADGNVFRGNANRENVALSFLAGAASFRVDVECKQLKYIDLIEVIRTDLLKVVSLRITIPVAPGAAIAMKQAQQNLHVFYMDTFGVIQADSVNLNSFFKPQNKTGNQDIVIDVPVNYFLSDKSGIALDLINTITNVNLSLIVEKWFNHPLSNYKQLV